MRAPELVHRGRHRCDGVIFDPTITGTATVRRRVLDLWSEGAKLLLLPDGRWLLLLAVPAELDSGPTGGCLVTATNAGLIAAPGISGTEGALAFWSHGETLHVQLTSLSTLDPSDWIAPGVAVRTLHPLAAPMSRGIEEPAPPPPDPDLRSAAGVGLLSTKARRFVSEVQSDSETSRGAAHRRGRGAPAGQPSTARGNGLLAKLALRSPLRHEIGRRHARYLEQLSKQFTRGELSEALRHAIPLGGLGGGALTLRLPQRRNSLALSGGQSSGRTVPLGPTVHHHLQALYRQAAKDLELSSQIDEAAFVLSELLNNTLECVALLERHHRYKTAATLSENRRLDPAITTRLWWLAGDRPRAMRLARKSNSYLTVLKYLERTDPDAAHQFRLLWVDELERSGNLHGAISIGWPDPEIRPLLVNLIERGVKAADQWSLGIHVYLVALHPSSANRQSCFAAMNDDQISPASLRFMAEALAEATSSDPIVDREICTAAIRALVPIPQRSSDKTFASAFRAIRNRADPIAAADLPSAPTPPRESRTVEIPPRPRGVRAIRDVAPLTNDRALVALGEAGVRLVTFAGRTAAEWSTPCHYLVPADHGKTAILLTDRETILEAHILDLVTRKVRYYGTIRSRLWSKSFDGATWAAVDDRGLVFYDILSESPSVAWREFEPGWVCHELERSPDSLAAVVTILPGVMIPTERLETWRWDLPGMRLDQRQRIKAEEYTTRLHLLSDATSIWERESVAPLRPVVLAPSGRRIDDNLECAVSIQTSGEILAMHTAEGTIEMIDIALGPGGEPVGIWTGIEEPWGLRSQGSLLAVWTESGNVAVVDVEHRRLLASLAIS